MKLGYVGRCSLTGTLVEGDGGRTNGGPRCEKAPEQRAGEFAVFGSFLAAGRVFAQLTPICRAGAAGTGVPNRKAWRTGSRPWELYYGAGSLVFCFQSYLIKERYCPLEFSFPVLRSMWRRSRC